MAKSRGRKFQNKEHEEYREERQQDFEESAPQGNQAPNTFFGLVDTQELEYFKQAESTLSINTFESPEEKMAFINSVFEESRGKELKLVTNQICSKLVERLILNSTDTQLKQLFTSFNGHFVELIHHKYSSHCVETLLVRSAALVEKELLNPHFANDEEEVFASMENMFLFMVNEFKPHLNAMLTHQYASHTLRLLLLILASKELPSTTKANSTLRSKKSKIARKMIDIKDNEDFNKTYKVPSSFKTQLEEIINTIREGLTTVKARELAIEKLASPVLQLIIQVEGLVDRDRKFWHLVFGREDEEKIPQEESFMEYLLSDAIGSHFLESCIKSARVKYVERLYKLYMADRVLKLAKRDNTGSYVVQALMEKLHQNEVRDILNELIPEMDILINNNLEMGSSILAAAKKDYKKGDIVAKLTEKYGENIVESVLQLSSSTLGNTKDDWPTAEERRRSLWLEKLIEYDNKFLNMTIESLLSLPQERMLQMCYHGVFSHVIESVLDVQRVELVTRKRLLNVLCTDVVNMSCNAYGSHIVDKMWHFTIKLNMYKERVAQELFTNKEKVKDSVYGRLVWKNWSLEMFVRRRFEWKRIIKEQELELFPAQPAPVVATPEQMAAEAKRKYYQEQESNEPKRKRGRNRN